MAGNIIFFQAIIQTGSGQARDSANLFNISAGMGHQVRQILPLGLVYKLFQGRKWVGNFAVLLGGGVALGLGTD